CPDMTKRRCRRKAPPLVRGFSDAVTAVRLGARLGPEAVARAERVVAVAERLQLLGEVGLQAAAVLPLVRVQVVDGALELALLLLQEAQHLRATPGDLALALIGA